ncbi:hypothetical protein [Parapedobacter soli]|uniref:hypothetical protein n=1 Tax=Parapedobacter soli TaxID=416955 RepID=UPI0021CA0173|nr:hypothetical protein [Parapedobacter soli]
MLLPPDDWDVGDGTKVGKIILSLTNPEDMRQVLERVLGELVREEKLINTGSSYVTSS